MAVQDKRMSQKLFFELIQVAIGRRDRLSRMPTAEEWQCLYGEAIKQSLVGVLMSGVERLYEKDAALKPPMTVFFEWVGNVSQIEESNKRLNDAAAQLKRVFETGGVRTCVLKGQGVAMLYPEPLRRQPGDIDLWVEGSRAHTLDFLKNSFLRTGRVVIHHVDAHIIEGVETEIHFLPSFSYNYFRYIKFKRFFKEEADKQFGHFDERLGFAYPTNRFNAVYLMMHIFRHVFHEGIGLRQLLDYYYVLKQLSEEERQWAYEKLKRLGLETVTGAVMYVLACVFLLEEKYLLCAPIERYGKFLLEEISRGGNFGKYDGQYQLVHGKNGLILYLANLKRLLKVFSLCPSEVLWAPVWKPSHWLWRKYKGYV